MSYIGWIKFLLAGVVFPLIGLMYIMLNRRISDKVNKETCEIKHNHTTECYHRHEKILKDIYDAVNLTKVDVAKLVASQKK